MLKQIENSDSNKATTNYAQLGAPLNYWYTVGSSSSLRAGEIRRVVLLEEPIALWRTESGKVSALRDRCPHRSVPLSAGQVTDDVIQCPYHGQEFAADGQCRHIPGNLPEAVKKSHHAAALPVREQQGLIWVYAAGSTSEGSHISPYIAPYVDEPGYFFDTIVREYDGFFVDGLENSADTIHTNFVHRWLFYGEGSRAPIDIVLNSYLHDGFEGIEATYEGEKTPTGLLARLLFGVIDREETIIHRECFIAPSIHQVEFRISRVGHIFANLIYTPVTATKTRITLVYAVRLKLPGMLMAPLVRRLFTLVIEQDCQILNQQAQNRKHFPGMEESSSSLDGFALEIRRYIDRLCHGESPASFKPICRTIKLRPV